MTAHLALDFHCLLSDKLQLYWNVNNADCGLFSIAFAYALCCDLDPHGIQFNQSAMWAHFDLCVDKEKIDMFPVSTRCWRKNTKSRIKSVKMVLVFCPCRRLPWDKADTVKCPLVKCSQCKERYHSKCDDIDLELYDAKNYCCSRSLYCILKWTIDFVARRH